MQNNEIRPATEKQINLLNELGYSGATPAEYLSMEEASQYISILMAERNEAKAQQEVKPQPKQKEVKQEQGYQPPVKNEVATTTPNAVAKEPKAFSQWMDSIGTKIVASSILDENRKNQFVANIVSAVASNPTLQECDKATVLSAALQADALHFPINNSLGYVYLVPFNDKKRNIKVAQFQIGYKGYIQLAIRSGQYKDINVTDVREGELKEYDPLYGMRFNWVRDYNQRKNLKVIGYAAALELNTGFRKTIYFSLEEMQQHADTYSQAFKLADYEKLLKGQIPQKDLYKFSSFWYKNFDEMAKKTCIRQLLGKWGIMSVEMQKAYENDQASFDAKGVRTYIDAVSREFENTTLEDVNNQQLEENASITPDIEYTADDLD